MALLPVSDVALESPVVRLALVTAPVAADAAEPAPAWKCTRNAWRSLLNCWKSAALPVGDVLPADAVCDVPNEPDAFEVCGSPGLLLAAVLLANRLGWVMLEMET